MSFALLPAGRVGMFIPHSCFHARARCMVGRFQLLSLRVPTVRVRPEPYAALSDLVSPLGLSTVSLIATAGRLDPAICSTGSTVIPRPTDRRALDRIVACLAPAWLLLIATSPKIPHLRGIFRGDSLLT